MANLQALVDTANSLLLGTDLTQKRLFLEKTPISPPHGGLEGTHQIKAMPKAFVRETASHALKKVKLTDVLDRICFIKFKAVESNTEGAEGSITFTVTRARDLKTRAERAGLIPCWFLPWKSEHLVKFKILSTTNTAALANPGAGYDPLPNPELFFTAAINGCSVFVYGDPAEPAVVHAGIESKLDEVMEPNVFQNLGNESTTVWRNLLEGYKLDPTRNEYVPKAPADHKHGTLKQNRGGNSDFGEVNRFDYISRRKATGGYEPVTNKSEELEDYLNRHPSGQLTQVAVNPFGCVFGLRRSNPPTTAATVAEQWMFTLQRNASVEYLRVYKKKKFLMFGGGEKTVGKGGNPALKFKTAVNLGFQHFFPQPAHVHYHALNSIQVF